MCGWADSGRPASPGCTARRELARHTAGADLLLVLEGGRRVAVELELTSKGRARREKILLGFAADSRVDLVLYLVDRPATARAIQASARQIGMSQLVRAQWVRWEEVPQPGRVIAARERARPAPAVAR